MHVPVNAIDSSERFDAAIEAIEKRSPVPREEWEAMTALEREAAFTVAHVTEAEVLQQVLDAVESAVRNGTDLEQFKDDIYAQLVESWGGEIPGRLSTIFRTNLMTAYGEGRHSIMSSPTVKQARPFWRYDATMDDRIDDECEELDQTVLPVDDPFWASHTPPLHYNCRCVIVPLSQEEADEEGVDDEGPDVEADEDFGAAPSAQGENWDFDLSRFDPELREELEAVLEE